MMKARFNNIRKNGDSNDANGRFAVWAFEYSSYLANRTGKNHARLSDYIDIDFNPPIVELITAPHFSNPNLHAQDGVFSLYRGINAPCHSIDRRSLDTLIAENLTDPSVTIFYEVTLPISHAENLMWMLAREGITAASMYPGYAGVVKCLEEEWPNK